MAIKRSLGYAPRKYNTDRGSYQIELLDEGLFVPLLNVIAEYLLEPSNYSKAGSKLFVAKFMPQRMFELFSLMMERLRTYFKRHLEVTQLQWVPAGQLSNGTATLLYGVGTYVPEELRPLFPRSLNQPNTDLFDRDGCLKHAVSVPAQVDQEAMLAVRYLGHVPARQSPDRPAESAISCLLYTSPSPRD